MKLLDQYDGSETPFEGDRTLLLRGLPAGIRVLHAKIHLSPVDMSGGVDPFTETITLTGNRGDWGAIKAASADWVEVNFHARRTLARVKGSNLHNTTLQVDLGGAYVEINDKGALMAPDGTPYTLSGDEQRLPGLTVVKFKLSNTGASPNIREIVVRSAPSNVSIRLGNLAPFWTQVGEITTPQSSTDFAQVLQAFISGQEASNGFYRLPFTLHSDTLARLSITVEIEYLFETTLLPAGLNEMSLPFDYGGVANIDEGVLQVALPPNAQVIPRRTTASVIGAFDESRIVYGPLGSTDAPGEALISPSSTQAQPIKLSENTGTTAIDLLLAAVTRTVRLQLDLREDLDGKPAGASLLTGNVEFTLDRESAGQATWISVPLPQEFQFQAQKSILYWLVMQSLEGEVVWSVKAADTDTPGLQNTRNGGLSWRLSSIEDITAPLAALFRLRYQPDRYQIPIELEIGSGTGAQRVKLDRFQPLGRVEFTLDLPEVAEAFNDYLQQAGPAGCIEAEHIADGAFNNWSRLGNELVSPASAALQHRPHAMVEAPDGLLTYVAATNTSTTYLEIFRATSGTVSPPISLGSFIAPDYALSISPDGQRLYLLTLETESRLTVFNTATGALEGEAFFIPDGAATGMTLSPDGARLYVAQYPDTEYESTGSEHFGVIRVYATADLAGVGGGPNTLQSINLGRKMNPRAIRAASSESGSSFLYVLVCDVADDQQCQIQRYETDHHTLVGTPLDVGKGDGALAIAPCGRRAVATNASANDASLNIIDLWQWKSEGAAMPLAEQPQALAITPDGKRAYVVFRHDNDKSRTTIMAIDLDQRRKSGSLVLDGIARDIALPPNGDRLHLLLSGGIKQLASIKTSICTPLEWAVTTGRATRLCFPAPFGNVVALGVSELGTTPIATTLAQVTPITSGCTTPFRFSFWGIATELDAVAEIAWMSEACEPLQSEQIPIEVLERENNGGIITDATSMPSAADMVLHSKRLTPPQGATQAEVRFKTAGGIAIIDKASLRVTAEATTNSELRLDAKGQPFNWTQQPGTRTGLTITTQGDGVQLSNTGSETISLIQASRITPDQAFELQFHGRAVDIFSEDSPPTVELHWLDSGNASLDTDISLAISSTDFERHAAAGTVPSQADQAEVRITLPPQTTLIAKHVSLRQQEPTAVPVGFLSHAPGELSISQGRVVYDLGEPTPPPVPSTGLCAPKQPKPTQARYACFCGVCEAVHEITAATPATTPAGRPAIAGTCGACGSSMINLGGQLDYRAPNIAFLERKFMPRKRKPETERVSAVLQPPKKYKASRITRVKGIGEARAQKLARAGITSIRKLAAIEPEDVQRILKTISMAQANQFVEEAKSLS